MKKLLCGALFAIASLGANAQSALAICNGSIASVSINYMTGSDAGQPGLFWIGLIAPDGSAAFYLDTSGNWQPYQSGLIPPTGRYDAGLPPTMQATIALPGHPTNTYGMQGWIVGLGRGVLTAQAAQTVAQRASVLAQAKPARLKAGTWNPAYDDDTQMRWAMVQQDMITNKKYQQALALPELDCLSFSGANGG